MTADAVAISIFTATAPATLTGPSEVEAEGALSPPVPRAPAWFSRDFESPKLSCLFVSLVTDWSPDPLC